MSQPQHMQALALANETRKRRHRLRFNVAGLDHDQGRALVADMISDGFDTHPDISRALTNARAVDVLRWARRLQTSVAARYIAAVGVSAAEIRTVGELTQRQRQMLADLLRGGPDRLRAVEEENAFELWRRQHGQDQAA